MSNFQFQEGEVLLVDKPLEWTSFDVVNKLRYTIKKHLNVKKIKVGHAGTLDPLATGLLLVCTGKKTKTIESLMGMEKEYTGTIKLGATTPSYDLETEENETFPTEHITKELVEQTALSFIGEQEQYPPIFSAKKIDGKRAYDLARKGKDVEMKPSIITINEFDVTRFENNEIDFRILCGKGTYIRSIAFDFGQKVNSGGYLTVLRRTKIGDFNVDNALSVEEFVNQVQPASLS